WKDQMLSWSPSDFGDIEVISVPIQKIWKPDIVLYNFADQRLKEHREALAVISNTGSVIWYPPGIFKSTCWIDIIYFPFDVQQCHLKFGSWTYDGYKLDLNLPAEKGADLSDYMESNEWMLVNYVGIKNLKFYKCCEEPYIDLTFNLTLKRIPFTFVFILIIPCILLSVLTLVSFWLPPETPAKILLG
ncbi:hypothetical protein HELRODRAFT_88426, partial [Helobdella robusta]|uniref:Uncharacterized protein n=1 Tax=Helobdella robusta TaxID=6412 RepID=T1G723_HELRO